MSVKANDLVGGYFKSGKGVRQGDLYLLSYLIWLRMPWQK
jgi:hypothetical protein